MVEEKAAEDSEEGGSQADMEAGSVVAETDVAESAAARGETQLAV